MNHKKEINIPSIEGFSNVKRYWDNTNQIVVAKVLPGQYYVTKEKELLTTVLGSCISACVRDSVSGVGGMNHFMLPETTKNRLLASEASIVGNANRYGNYAMEHLINTILSNGGKRKNLEIKVFGGGKITAAMNSAVGDSNIDFILEYIDTEALKLLSSDLGKDYPRKVNFYPETGRVRMKKIQSLNYDEIISRELSYKQQIKDVPIESEIELF